MGKMWGGRFEKPTNKAMERFNASIGFDWQLWAADIRGSLAYARALERSGLINAAEQDALIKGLEQVYTEFEAGKYEIRLEDEDIHTAVERRLVELIGEPARKLHTGRSRNDQVATDTRLYLLTKIALLRAEMVALQTVIIARSEEQIQVIMPGYTHMQQAQPILFSHWLMSFFWMLQRDRERLDQLQARVDVCPLGAGALAGNALGIDRAALAADLGFAQISENSLDTVADRDYVAEFLFWATLAQGHLSRLAEDLVIWSSAEYGFVQSDDAFTTGSSLMPQKRNPDALELLRGKAGRLIGHLTGLLAMLKGLPSTYDKDLQEDKEPLFDTVETMALSLQVAAGVIQTLKVNSARMQAALADGVLATDLADYLVRQGVPFRRSHELVGRAVRRAEEVGVRLRELPLAEYQAIAPEYGPDLYAVFDFRHSVERRDVPGGTATSAVLAQIERAKQLLKE
jgi:argininosuccinate lyase